MSEALYSHQRDGARILAAAQKHMLGDTPGLGKTRTLLEATRLCGARHTLVVVPAIVRTHWRAEIFAMGLPQEAYTVASYDAVTRGGNTLMAGLLRGGAHVPPVDALLLDESHYLKHGSAQRTRQLLGRDGYARRLGVVIAASGTPMPRHPGELWPVLSALFPEFLLSRGIKTRAAFYARFCHVEPRAVRGRIVEKVVGVKDVDALRELLGGVMLRRTLADVGLDVPPLMWQQVRLDAAPERPLADVDGSVERLVAAAIEAGTLAAIASDPHVARMRRLIGEAKAGPAAEMIADQLAGSAEKIVVFAHHRSVLGALREQLARFGVAYVDGDVPDAARADLIHRFQLDDKTRVFLGQNIACQTGITLTAASRVVLVEPDWTAAHNQQLGHRVARIGQSARSCIAQMVSLAGTLDDAIVGQHYREARQVRAVMGAAS